MLLQANDLIHNRYRIVQLIAQGGMGAVYQATDQRLGNTVALKQSRVHEPHLRTAFEHEARLLSRLQHPTLPVVSDYFSEGDEQFLVMQFIPGSDLGSLLKQHHFSPHDVLRWADDLLDALEYLHTQQPAIIHRDIKPQNLKLTARGDIVLLDFGLAKGMQIQDNATAASKSIFGYTPQYAPLEQIQGSGTDARSDLYSLAATLYHLLSGITPPDALTRASARLTGQPDPLRPLDELQPQIGTALAQVLHQALALNPSERFESAAALRAALQAAQAAALPASTPAFSSSGQPTLVLRQASTAGRTTILDEAAAQPASPQPAEEPTFHWWRNRRGMVLAALLIVISIVSIALLATFRPATSNGIIAFATASTLPDGSTPTPAIGDNRSNPFPAGQLVTLPGWEIQVRNIIRGREAWNRIYEANPNNDPALEGMEYLLLEIYVKRTQGGGEKHPIDKYTFRLTGSRHIDYNWVAAVDPEPRLEAELAQGETFTGWASYLVAEDEGQLMLIVDPDKTSDPNQRHFIALDPGARLSVDPQLRNILPTETGQELTAAAPPGTKITSEDWEVTVLDSVRGKAAWERIYAANPFNRPPEEGMEYIAVQVEVRFIGTTDRTQRIDASAFAIVDSQGRPYSTPSVIDPEPALDAYLFPGGRTTGWIAVQAPIGNRDIVLRFQPSAGSSTLNTRYLALATP